MKSKIILYSLIAVCAAGFAIFPPTRSAAQTDTDSTAAGLLLQEVQTQQATLIENQKQIDAKLADIGEALRVARIFVKRGGRGTAQ